MRAYFVKPDGTHFLQLSMGPSAPQTYRLFVAHPQLQTLERLNPEATHLEFVRTDLYTANHPRQVSDFGVIVGVRVYAFLRALRQVGPPIDQRWEAVPVWREEAPA